MMKNTTNEVYEIYESMKYEGKLYNNYNERYCTDLPNIKHMFVWSDMDTGKTSRVIDWLENNTDLSICFISNRISFTYEIVHKFKDFEFENYLTCEKTKDKSGIYKINSHRIIIQMESLHKLSKCDYDIIIIDEAFSLFSQIYSPTNKNKIYTNQKKLQYLFNNCKKSILLDAHLLTPVYNFYNDLCGGDLKIIKNEYQHDKGKVKFYEGDKIEFINCIFDDLIDGKKICLPTNVKKFGEYVVELLKNIDDDKFPIKLDNEEKQILKDIKYVFYYEKNKFKANLIANEEFQKYDLVIYSPTITTGIDVKDVHFDKIYAYCTNKTNDVFSFLQMLNRVRNLRKSRQRRNNYPMNIFTTFNNFDILPDNLTIEGIKDYYDSRKKISEMFVPKKNIECVDGYFKEFYNEDLFTNYYFEKIRIYEVSKGSYGKILEDLLKHKGYEICGKDSLECEKEIKKEIFDFVEHKILEKNINLFESAKLLSYEQIEKKEKIIRESMFNETTENEILDAYCSIQKTQIKMKVREDCDFTGEEYFHLFKNKYQCKNLINERMFTKELLEQLTETELHQKYNHEKTSLMMRYKLFSMFKKITGYSSFEDFEISTKFIEKNKDKLINFFDLCKIYLGKSYHIDVNSKRMTTSIMTKIKNFTLSWSGLTYETKRKRISGERRTYYILKDVDNIIEKYILNQNEKKDTEKIMTLEDIMNLY